ncbi:hypothetical protein AZE42_05181 [Rhizopogon vesiculosus]|uniref:ZZ-type domain-containing protein n=1 Tax=Rhizopogon vesiculosus TaxID=180088 RepID=A0A1J8PRB5_9AGAM|nr:hypothetical protein AZE42_05181 [Rhizopogon vesiculosus]
MFTVKATYRNETRKFSFPEKVVFPSYEELYHELYRIFPISHNYYLSKLIFSPDASKPSRILIGKEVHTAEEYGTRIAPLRRHWPNPLLRFSIFDETPHKAPSSTVEDSQKTHSTLPNFTAVPPPPVILSPPGLSRIPSLDTLAQDYRAHPPLLPRMRPPCSLPPPPPVILSPPGPPRIPSLDTLTQDYRAHPPLLPRRGPQSSLLSPRFLGPPISTSFPPPPPPIIFSGPAPLGQLPPSPPSPLRPQSCCSVSKGKSEMESLLFSFKKDFDRIMRNTFGPEYDSTAEVDTSVRRTAVRNVEKPTAACPSSEASYSPVYISPDTPSHWCFVCRTKFSGSWFGCVKCPWHFVCPSCFSKSGAVHTSSFGPTHVVRQHGPAAVPPSIAVTPPAAEVPAVSQSRRTSPAVDAGPNQRQPVVHRNVACDSCKKTIVGIRRKCLDCPDYDLCTPCIESGAAEKHNPFHEFFDIETSGRVFVHTVFSGRGERSASAATRAPPDSRPRSTGAVSNIVEPVRHFAACNLCDSPIVGDRFKCVNCPDFDTCATCFKITGEQHPNHGFVRVSKTSDLMMRNALTSAVTHYATCNSCKQVIRGVRYKCMHASCPDFDLCQDCEALPIPVHPSIHPLLKMKAPDTVIPTVYRVGETDLIQPRGYCSYQGNTSPQAHCAPKSPSVPMSMSRTASECSVSEQREQSVVAPESLSPVAISGQCPEEDSVSAGSVGPQCCDLAPAVGEQSASPHTYVPVGDLVETSQPSTAEVRSPPLDLDISLDIFREMWPKVNREMKHLIDAKQPEVKEYPSSSAADLEKVVDANLVNLEESADLPLLQDMLLATPSPFHLPPMMELKSSPLISADRGIAALMQCFRTSSPVASEALACSGTTIPALDSVLGEKSATPVLEERLPSPSCAFMSDTTVPDGQIFPPGAEFVKAWRMLNDGETPWPETTELHFVAGESFTPSIDVPTFAKVGRVNPGEDIDVWTGELKAPDVAGRYVGYWKLKDGKGESFGANIWIDVTVAEPQSADEASDHSLASSSMIMPHSSSNPSSAPSADVRFGSRLGHLFEPSSPSTSKPATDVMDDVDSDSSSVSLISVPSSDDYESEWQDARSQGENLEYVVLYDSNGSEDE